MIKEVKESMIVPHQIENINKMIEIIFKRPKGNYEFKSRIIKMKYLLEVL